MRTQRESRQAHQQQQQQQQQQPQRRPFQQQQQQGMVVQPPQFFHPQHGYQVQGPYAAAAGAGMASNPFNAGAAMASSPFQHAQPTSPFAQPMTHDGQFPQQHPTTSKTKQKKVKAAEKQKRAAAPDTPTGQSSPEATLPEDGEADAEEETEAAILSRRILMLDSKISAIAPYAKDGHVEAQQEMLNFQAQKRAAMEARTRLEPAEEQVKILTRVLNGKKKTLKREEELLATARESVTLKEDAVRKATQEVDKVSYELERAEALKAPNSPPKLEVDAKTMDMLAALGAALHATGGQSLNSLDPAQVSALALVLDQAKQHADRSKSVAAVQAAGLPTQVMDVTTGHLDVQEPAAHMSAPANTASNTVALPQAEAVQQQQLLLQQCQQQQQQQHQHLQQQQPTPATPTRTPLQRKRAAGSQAGSPASLGPAGMSQVSPVPLSQQVHSTGHVMTLGSGEPHPKQPCVDGGTIGDEGDDDVSLMSSTHHAASASSHYDPRGSNFHQTGMAPQMMMQDPNASGVIGAANVQQMQQMQQMGMVGGVHMANGTNQVFQFAPTPMMQMQNNGLQNNGTGFPMSGGGYGPIDSFPIQFNMMRPGPYRQGLPSMLGTM